MSWSVGFTLAGARAAGCWGVASTPEVFHHRLGPGMDMEFFIDRAHVAAYGVNANGHPVGDLLVGVALGELIQKVLFSRRQPRNRRFPFPRPRKILDHAPGELWGHG